MNDTSSAQGNQQQGTSAAAPNAAAPTSNGQGQVDWQQRANHATDKLHEWMAKATHYEKTWGTLGDFDQVKTALDGARKRSKDSTDDGQTSGKGSRETEALQAQLGELSKKLESSQQLNKQLRVTTEAMKYHGAHFVPKSEAEIENIVTRSCDFDEKANCIVVKDSKGDVRYSKERPGNLMTVEELFSEIKTERPYLAKADVRGGTMQSGNPAHSAQGLPNNTSGIPDYLFADQKALTQYLKNNPTALTNLLNNGV